MAQERKLSIIVADDHPALREGLIACLQNKSFVGQLKEASNGNQVISLLELFPCDIVLMDIRMSPLNGIETTKIIQTRFPETKVLAITMHDEIRMMEMMKDVGAAGFIAKSATIEEIVEAITTILKGEKYFKKLHITTQPSLFTVISKKENSTKAQNMREILYLLCIGKISKEIAAILHLSPRTIEVYRGELNKHLNISNMAGLIRYGIESGILDDEILKTKFKCYSNTCKVIVD